MMKPIDLYVVPPSPPCRAVIMAAKYMNVNVKLIQIDLMKGEQKEDWFVKMNPQHILPTINDNGFILWESRAIMSYFANKYAPNDPIYPHDPKKRGIVDRLMQYDLNVFYRALGDFLIPVNAGEGKMVTTKFLNIVKERKVIEALSFLDSVLTSNQYLAGDYLTLADFSVYCSLEFAEDFQYDLSKYKNICRYFNSLKQTFNAMMIINSNIDNEGCVDRNNFEDDLLQKDYDLKYLSILHQQQQQEQEQSIDTNFILVQDPNIQHFNQIHPQPQQGSENLYQMLNLNTSLPQQHSINNNHNGDCNSNSNKK